MFPKLDTAISRLANALAGVFERDGVNRLGAGISMVLQIVQGNVATKIRHDFHKLLCYFTLVKAFLAVLCKELECVCNSRVLHDLTCLGRPAAVLCGRVFLQHLMSVW